MQKVAIKKIIPFVSDKTVKANVVLKIEILLNIKKLIIENIALDKPM